MTLKLIYGKEIAGKIKKTVIEDVKQFIDSTGVEPKICTFMVGEDKPSQIYMNLRKKACDLVGIDTEHIILSKTISEDEFIDLIVKKNLQESIHGILVQLPLPDHISTTKVFEILDPGKDVEGLTPYNMGKTLIGDEYLVPCTPQAVLRILEHIQVDIKGKNVVIVNHSTIVGKPLAALCLNRNATVSICHVFTKDITPFTRKADILITAAGVPGLITADHVKKDGIIIDVSIVKTTKGVTGDVDVESVKDVCKYLTPVPGGVGPVTIACALENMVKTMNLSYKDRIYE
jgi:methylenetetrahydrofolate dehydrogenase (NADP+)/methenyltetrahydrofolate cyclohydrolase